ncbi:MAG: hypothetical protein IPK87_06235 [Planctomycetes bacterium]|nr:hypothetical protein [Planctomycetota bacterium]
MSDEPNLRALERALTGQPQGWGEFPPGKPSRPMPTQAAEVAPAQASEPALQRKPRAPIPGFWMSLAGIIVSPFRLAHWIVLHPRLLIYGVVASFVFLAVLPIMSCGGGSRDARRSEGEQMLGSMKNQARVAMAKTKREPWTLTGTLEDGGCAVASAELESKYFTIDPRVQVLPDGRGRLRCYPSPEADDQAVGYLTFHWDGGDGTFEWIEPGAHK